MPTSLSIDRLRAEIAALEGSGHDAVAGTCPLGVPELDGALPWGGLPLGCLHEIAPVSRSGGVEDGRGIEEGGVEDGAVLGFTASLLGRLGGRRPVLWVAARDDLYAPGLTALGLDPARLLVVRPGPAAQVLWALEEAVRCPALGGVAGEVWNLDFTAARRLHLAARSSGVPVLLLNRGQPCGPAMTRWRVGPDPSVAPPGEGVGPWRWRVELVRCRGRGVGEDGVVSAWMVEWDDETRGFRVAAPAGHRPPMPAPRSRRGLRAAG